MVRLKEVNPAIVDPMFAYFNSTMVRLKDIKWKTDYDRCVFQFHYGTIKSFYSVLIITTEFDFNSTMVRLKGFSIS